MNTSEEQKKANYRYYLLAFRIIGDFGATIAIPILVFVYIGQWLSERYNLGYFVTIIAFVLAALLSGYMIWKKAKAYGREYMSIDQK